MKHLGDYDASTVIYGKFTTFRPSTGAAFTLGGTPALSVYKDNSTTQSTTGVTLTADFDSVTGLNHFAIDTSADGAFYAAGSFFDVVITTGTVDSVSVVGTVVASFTIRKDSSLKPTTAGRTLDVTAGGEAGIDWANVGSPTTAVNLSGTTISTSQAVASVSGAVGSVTGLTAANLDVAVSTRLASASYTAPLDAAGVRTAVGLASANLDTQLGDLPTNAELATALGAADDAILAILGTPVGASISDDIAAIPTAAEINAELVDVLTVDTYAEPSAVPAATASIEDKISWLAALARNKITQTATTQTLRNDADSGNIATAALSDDGSTMTRARWT